ncbi:interferon-induced protein 44 isoform X1 [Nelusetta ayraudi]|uniref:interferon-induced protein 44 isoform X1 n=1 Tax=Nelusetta ayraudi TaxID=303726 RepID=UPI003F71B43B
MFSIERGPKQTFSFSSKKEEDNLTRGKADSGTWTLPEAVFKFPTTAPTTIAPKDSHYSLFGTPFSKLESAWRVMEWTEERKKSLMEVITSFAPKCADVPQARVLFLGPMGSGKSSFISSVQSAFSGRVTNRAMVGCSPTGCTKKLQSFKIQSLTEEDPDGLLLCDVMGLGDSQTTGIHLHDILSVIKGHVPEGHRFSPYKPVMQSETEGFVKRPELADKIHCVAFVLSATQIQMCSPNLSSTMQQLREHISDLGVHQVALLTHIDEVCMETAKDLTHVYKSANIQAAIKKAAALLGMPPSYIVPVKNYFQELTVDSNNDVLLLSAVDHILQYCNLYFQDSAGQNRSTKWDEGL